MTPRTTEEILDMATKAEPGDITLRDIYGYSYFGSGGGWGYVRAFDLKEWKLGRKVEKEVQVREYGDNGFISGPAVVTIGHNTLLLCRGGDCINGGRSWGETYLCEEGE